MTRVEAPAALTGRESVRLATLTSRFGGAVRAMANSLGRTGRSGVLNTARDYSCCILSADHRLVAMAESLPIHVMSGPDLIAAEIWRLESPRAGDAFLHNSPYHGNSHAADHSLVVPVMDDEGRHRFTVFAKAHQADCGNAEPTTYMAHARDVYEEGALIFHALQVQSGYEHRQDVLRMCRLRMRVPDQWWGDYLALLGAARVGERAVAEIGQEVGWDALDSYVDHLFDYSESLMAAAIGEMPAGELEVTGRHDPFPGVPDGVEIRARLSVDPAAGRIAVDLTDNPDCLPCGLNLTESTTRTAVLIGIFNALPVEVPHNAGSFRRVDIALRDGSCVGIPAHPVSCSLATTGLANRLGNAVQRGLAELAEGAGMAEAGLIMPPSMGVVSGVDRRGARPRPFVNQLFLGQTGGAARAGYDGWLNTSDLGAGGMIRVDSVEVDELQQPIVVETRRLLADTEGAGRFRGAPGILVEYEPLDGPIEVMYASDGSVEPAAGARGGGAGASAGHRLLGPDGPHELPSFARVSVAPGERVVSTSCGGGGYGPPWERDPEAVRRDVAEGLVTRERALRVYGVVLDPDGAVDPSATARRRGEMRSDEGSA